MDIVEDDKLKWIGELPKEVKIPKDPYPARFNFEGRLLPFCDKGEGVLQGLHNHGDEQERPGYSLQELIQLSRSSVLQQRVIAINTLANIMANASNYDECFDTPVLPALLEADTFLLLRFSLDDPAQPVVSAAAAAICNLIVNHLDELCLDILLGTPLGIQQPSFGVALEVSKDDISELKDQELLKLDIIKGALRTDLLTRIKYILVDLSTEPVEIKHLLKTITRIARHSYETADIVFKCPGLLEKVRTLVDKGDEGSYYPEALKLFRILCARSKTFAAIIASDYRVLEAVFSFIAGDKAQRHPETMQLTLESFYTWQTFLNYNIAFESIGQLTPVLLRLLDAHYGLTDISGANSDLEHGTALVSTLSCAAKLKPGVIAQAIPLLLNCTRKWLLQYEQGMSKSFQASKLVGAALTFFTYSFSDFDSSKELFPILESILNKSSITHAVQRLRKYSWLIRGKVMSCPENLPCLGSVPPTVQEESSFPFVYSLATYLLRTKNLKLIDSFINNEEVTKYIVEVLKEQNIILLCGHWYARQEIYLLVQLVHLYIMAEIKENEAVYHKLAFTLLTSIQSGDKYLLSDIISKAIFNSKFFRPDVEVVSLKMQELCLENVDGIMKHQLLTKALEEIKEIEMCYTGELGLQGLVAPWPPVTLTGLLNSTQCALPSDWIFMPILRLYNNQSKDANSAQIAKRCLQWFIILEELFPEFSIGLTVTAKYCRLCCVYLAGNDLFRDVTQLLDLALHHIMKHSSQLDFEASIPGLTSFYDFYREVLEQFAFISYGDHVFGKYVLVPLAQCHDVKYKKLVWSELSAVLRALSTPVNGVNMELYLEPLEADFDLLMSYLSGLATGRIRECWCPILYKVAVHHVSRYVKENTDKSAQLLHSRIVSLGNQDLRELLLN
ncbi:RNA polymerase II-associated protein 1 isoform X2 [Rhodnius prolixus]